jgi:hypothetical protein
LILNEQNLWWLVPYALMMLVMVHAMAEFFASLRYRSPGKG